MEIRRRNLGVADRPLFSRQDALFLLELPVLFLIAALVPEDRWPRITARLGRTKARLGMFSPAAIQRGLSLVFGDTAVAADAYRIAATRSEHHLQIIRDYFFRRRVATSLEGGEEISRGLSAGNGVILWVAHFSFNSLASKQAISAADFEVAHLSRPEHGFSKSKFGVAVLNPIRVNTELRYLDGRIIIDRAHPGAAVQKARKRLAANKIVSITAGAWEGLEVATVVLDRVRLELATGAPGVAYLTGATLLPVFTVRDEGATAIRVVVGEPIPVDRDAPRRDALFAATQAFADRLLPFVRKYPLQWRDWEKIKKL